MLIVIIVQALQVLALHVLQVPLCFWKMVHVLVLVLRDIMKMQVIINVWLVMLGVRVDAVLMLVTVMDAKQAILRPILRVLSV